MDTSTNPSATQPQESGMTELSPLDLNNIRLDVKHTVLTPELLESLRKEEKK